MDKLERAVFEAYKRDDDCYGILTFDGSIACMTIAEIYNSINKKFMERNKFEFLEAILNMAKDDNKGLRMSNTIAEVKKDSRGAIVGFGVEPDIESPAILQKSGLPSSMMCFAFFIDREELKKYLNK